MEDVGREGHEGRQRRIAGREGYLKAQNCRGIWTCGGVNIGLVGETRQLLRCMWFRGRVRASPMQPGLALNASLRGQVPLRTKITPTHSDGSPGVMLTKTPSSCANRRLELHQVSFPSQAARKAARTYNSTRSCCFRNDRSAGEVSGRGIVGAGVWARRTS